MLDNEKTSAFTVVTAVAVEALVIARPCKFELSAVKLLSLNVTTGGLPELFVAVEDMKRPVSAPSEVISVFAPDAALLLNVLQSVEERRPRLEALEVGKFKVNEPPSAAGEPDTPASVPDVPKVRPMVELAKFAFGIPVGKSAVTNERNAGVVAEPVVGPANIVLAG